MKENAHSSQYLLMNKDVCILHFFCAHNEFGEVLFAEEEWLVQYRPIGYHGLQDFLEQRRAPKHRAYIRELLEQCGCGDMEGFLRVTHALLSPMVSYPRQITSLCIASGGQYF
ncbi:hypothetical protein DW651_17270 [Subdoligranulum sp. AM23-21AC]|nr:hypothetical protein DW651_17270 [Subdoligranulum sp. AM23-21AC]